MDERRRNKRGRITYEIKQSAIATLSVAISWIILFVVTNLTMDIDAMNYEFLFRMLLSLLILVTILSYSISVAVDKIFKYFKSKRKSNKK